MTPARLLFPPIRWREGVGFADSWSGIERGLALGVGGFIIFGGEAASVSTLIRELRRRSSVPLLIASDLERGAGQQFRGATSLPPAAALAWLNEPETIRAAADLTAREARQLGVDWLLAPVCDLDHEPRNPIVSTRSFGSAPERAADAVREWIRSARRMGALTCAKHFPGHGRTTEDSHLALPVVDAGRDEMELDLVPFRAAVDAGVDSVMTAHVAYPALADVRPATRVATLLEILRSSLGFDGIIVSDALEMPAFAGDVPEHEAAVEAIGAGCDVLLCPSDPPQLAAHLSIALRRGAVDPRRIAESTQRLDAAFATLRADAADPFSIRSGEERAGSADAPAVGLADDVRWSFDVAVRCVHALHGEPETGTGVGAFWIAGEKGETAHDELLSDFSRALVSKQVRGGRPVVAVIADVRAGRGRAGLSDRARADLDGVLVREPDATVLLFGHPRLLAELGDARHVVCAWSSEPLMQRAAAAWLGWDPSR